MLNIDNEDDLDGDDVDVDDDDSPIIINVIYGDDGDDKEL